VTSEYSADRQCYTQLPKQFCLGLAENLGHFSDPPGIGLDNKLYIFIA